jgi:hypothetical protein
VASITSIQNHSRKDNERRQEHNQGPNILHNTLPEPSIYDGPRFDLTTTSKNVSFLVGSSAFLDCSVINLDKNVVSWMRHIDMNVLSVGKFKYTQDYRISSHQNNFTWTLKVNSSFHYSIFLGSNLSFFFFMFILCQIKQVNKKDEGFYECQISTSPTIGHVIYLRVMGEKNLELFI